MYRLILMLVIACILSGCATENFGQSAKFAGKDNAIVVTDDTGYQVKLKKKPEKIMTNNIYLDNILLGLVEPEKMLSVSKNMDNSAKSFGNMVSSLVENKITNPGVEAVLALKPDIFIVNEVIGADKIQSYRDMGIPVYVVRLSTNIEEVKNEIIKLSRLVGEEQRGKILVQKMNDKLARIERNIPKELHYSKSTVLVSANYASYGGKGCMYDDICKHAKIRNGIADLGMNTGQTVNKEVMIEINPDFFFLAKPWKDNKAKDEKLLGEFLADKSLENLRAVKNGNVALLDEKYIFIGHQNCVWSVQKLAHLVYGDCVVLEPEEFLKGF